MKIKLKIKIDHKDMTKIDLSLDIDLNKPNINCLSNMMVIYERVKQHWRWVEKKVLLIKIKRVVRFCCCCFFSEEIPQVYYKKNKLKLTGLKWSH